MKNNKIGFVDIQSSGVTQWASHSETSSPAFRIYIFKNSRAGYVFEKSIEISGNDSYALPGEINDINEFFLSIPLELLNFRILKLPFSDREKIKKVIPFELDSLIIGGSDRIIFDSIVLGNSGNKFDILVPYVDKEILKNILTRLSTLNVDPCVVTSIELPLIAGGSREDIGMRLLNEVKLSDGERIAAAKEELISQTVNFRTGTFAYTKDSEKLLKTLKTTVILLILFALTINSGLALRIINNKKEVYEVKKEIRDVYSGIFPNEKKITDELYLLKSHIKEIKDRGDALSGVSPLQVMLDLSRKKLQGVIFDEINIDKELLTIKGEAGSVNDAGKLKEQLSDILKDVSISDIKPTTDGKVYFTAIVKGNK